MRNFREVRWARSPIHGRTRVFTAGWCTYSLSLIKWKFDARAMNSLHILNRYLFGRLDIETDWPISYPKVSYIKCLVYKKCAPRHAQSAPLLTPSSQTFQSSSVPQSACYESVTSRPVLSGLWRTPRISSSASPLTS